MREKIIFTAKVIGYPVLGFLFLGLLTGFTWEGMQFVLTLFGATLVIQIGVKLAVKEIAEEQKNLNL